MKSAFLAATLIGAAIAGLIVYYSNGAKKSNAKQKGKLPAGHQARSLHSMG